MSKVYTYMVLCVGLIALLKFAGIPTGADSVLTFLGLAEDISEVSAGAYFAAVLAIFVLGAGAGIAISFITKSPSETWVVGTIASGIFTVITATFVSVISYTKDMGFVYYLTYLIFAPLLMGFGIAIIQFWRGTD